jgi:hypothetical protein
MEKILTAKEFLKDTNLKEIFNSGPPNLETILIEFAKMHCKAQAKIIAEKIKNFDDRHTNNYLQDSILTAYPESNIV